MKKSSFSKRMRPHGRAPLPVFSGAGNTFALLDALRACCVPTDLAATAKHECGRLGVDGLLVMQTSKKAPIRMRIFNPDGSEAEMCGNGSRCAALWAYRSGAVGKSQFPMETGAGLVRAAIKGRVVRVRLTDPKGPKGPFEIKLNRVGPLCAYSINTGVPHVVIEREDLKGFPVDRIGREIRAHSLFKPRGTNASFFKRLGKNEIYVRTFERGVEEETNACGTGSAACALVAAAMYGFKSPVRVLTASGERLMIYFDRKEKGFRDVHLEGPVKTIQKGKHP